MACTSGSVWASRHTLPAPCRQQHRYLTQHVSSLSLSLSLSISGVQSATISGCARLLLLTKSISERQLCLSWCLQSRDKSAPSPSRSTSKSISKDRGGSGWVGGGLLGMLVIFVAVQSFQTEMHSWRRGRRGWFEPASKRLSCPPPLLAENTEPHPGLSQ